MLLTFHPLLLLTAFTRCFYSLDHVYYTDRGLSRKHLDTQTHVRPIPTLPIALTLRLAANSKRSQERPGST